MVNERLQGNAYDRQRISLLLDSAKPIFKVCSKNTCSSSGRIDRKRTEAISIPSINVYANER